MRREEMNINQVIKTTTTTSEQVFDQQNQVLKEKFGIDMVNLFADIYNSILDTTADSIEDFEKILYKIHAEFCTKENVPSDVAEQQRQILKQSLDRLQAEFEQSTNINIDRAEIYASKSVFALKDYMDPNLIQNIVQNEQQSYSTQGGSSSIEYDEEQINREILDIRRQIQFEQQKNRLLVEEGKKMAREIKFYEQNIGKFNFLQCVQKEENVESWAKLVENLVKSGKEIHRQILASKKQTTQDDAMDLEDPSSSSSSAFNQYTSTPNFNSEGGQSDLKQIIERFDYRK